MVLGGGKPRSSLTLLMTQPRHRNVADLVDLDANIFNDSTSTLMHRQPSIILQGASEPVDRSWMLDSTRRGGDVAEAVIVAVLAFLILLCCRIGFWRLLWERLYSFAQMSHEAVHVRTISVAITSMWIFVNLVSWALEVARPFYLSDDMPVGNDASTTTERGRGEGNDTGMSSEESANWVGPQKFTYKELEKATNHFASDQKLGQGASGTVYRGNIGKDRELVAVKMITSVASRRISEYIAEIITMIQLSHTNLVKLKGYCHESNEFALVYEYIGGGTLHDHLFERNSLLTWERRYNIALGLASALCYLHKKRPQRVIHRDVKSENIMLNEAFVAKLGDFGLAKLVDHNREQNTTQVVGTFGYLDPEYYQTGKVSKESDLYSFGVVLLEIVCGRRAVDRERDPKNIVVWVWKKYGPTKLLDAVDTRLGTNFDERQAKALMIAGLWCANPDATSRLSIEAAMEVLSLKAEPPKLPRKMPAYFY